MQAGFGIEGSVALVTGAAGGLGGQIVQALLARGAAKVYAATRTGDAEAPDARVVPVGLDITDDAQVARTAARCADVTLLVNNAGVNRNVSFLAATSLDAARSEMEANYFGTLRMCRGFAPVLARVPGATIVNVVSMAANKALPAMGSLCASKAAELRLTECLRLELAAQGTRVMAFLPGPIDTGMTRHLVGVPKLTPQEAARALLDGLAAGEETVTCVPAAR